MAIDHRYMDGDTAKVVGRLIILNIVVYILQTAWSSEITFHLKFMANHWQQPWRWVTYTFCHSQSDAFHIIFNMWSLYIFGPPVAEALGSMRFLKLYFISGIIGAGCWLAANYGTVGSMVGASGALFGVMAAAAILFPNDEIILLFPPMNLKIKTLVIVLTVASVLLIWDESMNIAHLGHLGGLAGGFLFTRHAIKPRKAAPPKPVATAPTLHRCATCGVTEVKAPQKTFRVCSRCTGGREYCDDHIREHKHT